MIATDGARESQREPRWPAAVAMLAVAFVYTALPDVLSVGPSWLLIVLVVGLEIPTIVSHRAGLHTLNYRFGVAASAVVTAFMIWSVWRLVATLPEHTVSPGMLLRSAAALWLANILIFALWYWRLDAGGPHMRDRRAEHVEAAFLFPQMTLDAETKRRTGQASWSPNFWDYLFLAFNASTALSPTDAPVLSRWAKVLMMAQAMISLAIVVLLAARAVNIL